jgi:hypothetical protein
MFDNIYLKIFDKKSNYIFSGNFNNAAILLLIGVFTGILISGPIVFKKIALGGFLLLVLTLCFFKFSKEMIIVLGAFLVFQQLLCTNIERFDPAVAIAVRRLEELVILHLFVLVFLKKVASKDKLMDKWVAIFLFGIIITGLLSSIINNVPFLISAYGLFLMTKGFLIFLIIESVRWNEAGVRKWVKTFLVIAVLLFFCGVIDFLFPVQFRNLLGNTANPIDYRAGLPSVISLSIHPGEFGWLMAVASIFCLAFYVFRSNKWYFTIGLLFFAGMFSSFRVKPILGLIAALVVAFISYGKARKHLWKVVAVIIIGYCISFNAIWPVIATKTGNLLLPEKGLSVRRELYLTSFKIASDHFPFGAGLGRYGGFISRLYYSPVYDNYGLSEIHGLSTDTSSYIMDTHWANILGELGVLGFIAYLCLCGVMIKKVWRYMKVSKSIYLKAFSFGVFIVFIESLFESVATPIYQTSIGIYFVFGTMAVVSSLADANGQKEKNQQTA